MKRSIVAMVAGVLLAGVGCSPSAPPTDGRLNAVPAPAARAPVDAPTYPAADEDIQLGATPVGEVVAFTVSLVLPGKSDMQAFLDRLYDPASSDYRQFLTAEAFGSRFGLPLAAIDDVIGWLAGRGIDVVSRTPQRTSLEVRGTVGDVNRLFGVTLEDWLTAEGGRYHRPATQPVVPGALEGKVASIVGLDSQPVLKARMPGLYGAGVLNGALRPEDAARAYEIDPLHAAGLHGEGQTVAIISFDTFFPEDITAWDAAVGTTGGGTIESVRLGNAVTTPSGSHDEVTLDIQVIRGIAPAATILNYEAPNNFANMGPMVARIVADGRASLINVSWGKCEKNTPPGAMESNEQEFAAAFAAGVSIFVASGDDGAYTCRRDRVATSNDPFERDLSASVASPSSSPSVISVGGTFLSVREDGSYFSEAGWEDPLGGGGTGGGLSTTFQRPSYQQGLGVDNSDSNGMRQLPDVAGPADPASGFFVIYTPVSKNEQGDIVKGQQRTTAIGGTSAAAPFWVGSMVLTQQLAGQRGVDRLGALGPLLYQIAQSRPDVFHDVVRGGNLLHDAGTGWDYATGLGTPRVAPLADVIVQLLSR